MDCCKVKSHRKTENCLSSKARCYHMPTSNNRMIIYNETENVMQRRRCKIIIVIKVKKIYGHGC